MEAFLPTLAFQWVAAFAFLICLITLGGESACLPSRNRFCIMTKIPTEVMYVELPLVAWSAPWYGVSVAVMPTSSRVVFYGGIIHLVGLAHAMLTLYNNLREVDLVDRILLTVDVALLFKATHLMVRDGRLTEASAILLAVVCLWLTVLSSHVAGERVEKAKAEQERLRRKERASKRQAKEKKHRKRRKQNEGRRPREDRMASVDSTLLR